MNSVAQQLTEHWMVPSAIDDEAFALGIMRLSPTGEVLFANRAARSIIGGELRIGMNITELPLDAESRVRLEAQLSRRFAENRGDSYKLRFERRDICTWVQVNVSAVPEYDASGRCTGSIGFFLDESIDAAATDIHAIIGRERSAGALFMELRNRLRQVIQFDSMMVNGINLERELIGEIFEYPAPPPRPTPTCWWQMRPFVKEMFVRLEKGPLDLIEMFQRPEFIQYAKDDPAVAQFQAQGFKSVLRIPVIQANSLVAMLSLLRKNDVPFTQQDFERCQRLPLVEAVKVALRFEIDRNIEFTARFVETIAPMKDAESIGQLLVNQLACHHGWDHVSLFRLSPASTQLELVCQAGSGESRYPDGYSQAMSIGLLGQAQNGEDVVVGDVTDEKWRHLYHKVLPETISEMVLPVPGTTNHWLLNVESSKRNAFADEEPEAVKVQLDIAGFILERMASLDVQTAIVKSVADAVFITNDVNVILSANPAAADLLGRDASQLKNRSLAYFIAPEPMPAYGEHSVLPVTDPWSNMTTLAENTGAAEALARLLPQQHLSVEFANASGERIPVTLSVAVLPKRLGGKVFVVTDSRDQINFQRSQILNKVYYQLASEIRVPLALSDTFLTDAYKRTRGETREMIDKARKQIGKADLPLERIVRLAARHREEALPRSSFDLRKAIDEMRLEFPRDEARQIRVLKPPKTSATMPIEAPRKELLFCVRSLVAYLMTRKAMSETIDIELRNSSGDAAINIALPPLEGEDAGTESLEADSDFTLIEPVIEDLMTRMDGSLQRADHERFGFKLQFKAGPQHA